MAHLLIIDALNLIRRLHAVQSRQEHGEMALQATQAAMTRCIGLILKEVQPSHVLAVFDGDRPSWRHDLYPAYKAGRTPMPEELQTGLPRLQAALWELGIDSLLSESDEADDLIATLNHKMRQLGQAVTLISTDKGFCQLLDSGIRIRDYFNKRWLDAAFVQQQFGVRPDQLVDFWALTGLSGANIKGVPGIGPKTARQLLLTHGTLAAMLEADGEDRWLGRVKEHKAAAQLARTLARLRTDIPLGFNLKDIRYPH